MKFYSLLVVFLFSSLVLFNCQQTTEGENNLELSQIVEEQAAFGFQVNELASTSTEIEQVTSDPFSVDVETDLPTKSSVSKLRNRAVQMAARAREVAMQLPMLAKTAADSAIWSNETHSNGYGRRSALYYNDETGMGRWVEVVFEFPESRNMIYDSTEISVDMNFTLWNGNDDILQGLFQQQQFNEVYFIQSIESVITIDSFDEGGEPNALTATVDSRYQQDRELQRKLVTASMVGDESGSVREDFWFKDGTSTFAEFTYKNDNTGTFSKSRRDGTVISGTFNQLEDDGYGSYTSVIDFPSGYYLDKILRAASVWAEDDSSFRADYAEKIIFGDGNVDSTQTNVTVTENDGVTTTVMDVLKRNGAHGTITVVEGLEMSTLSGTWTTWDNYYIVVSAEYYIDGSSHMHYEVFTNEDAYNNGDVALIIADYTFNGDQGGEGTLTHDGNAYNVEFDGSGTATVSDGANSSSINLYY